MDQMITTTPAPDPDNLSAGSREAYSEPARSHPVRAS